MGLRQLLLLAPCSAVAVHVAFIAPPASHYVPMLAIAHGLLDDGHNVTFLGYRDTTDKISRLVPRATMHVLEGEKPSGPPQMLVSLPYNVGQVLTTLIAPNINGKGGPMAIAAKKVLAELRPDALCVSFIYPIFYALAETLDIPAIGIGWASPNFLTLQNDLPWTTEPVLGSIHTRQELYDHPILLLENLVVRVFSFFTMQLGSLVNIYFRFRLEHPQPFEPWVFDAVLQHPMVIMTLPEFTAGMPMMVSPYTFMVGILDHPKLGGSGMAKSDDAERIVSWLDEQHASGTKVLYVAFGSEAALDDERMRFLAGAFEEGKFTVLWATKTAPKAALPKSIFVTKFAPQRAVLQHSAVFGFLSHGGANSVNEGLMFGTPMAIMPFFGDQMTVAVAQAENGVAVLVRKDVSRVGLIAALQRLTSEPLQRRARDFAELNAQRRDMSRAVQVIEEHASGRFPMRIPRVPNVARLAPLLLCLLLASFCCGACGCCRVRCQRPCGCCRRRGGQLQGSRAGAVKSGKQQRGKKQD